MATTEGALSAFDIDSVHNAHQLKIGIVTAEWNPEITHTLRDGAISKLISKGILPQNINSVSAPGSFELPLAAQYLLESGYDGVICFGCLIKGDTPHFEYICESTSAGIMRLNIDYKKPVIFGVLTCLTHQQAMDRAGGILGNKGDEAAVAVLKMLDLKAKIQ